MYNEDELLPISALQHLLFCERRAALILLEQMWEDNIFTTEGSILHERTHATFTETRADIRIVRQLRLRSLVLGLTGIADIVEFHLMKDKSDTTGIVLLSAKGIWRLIPVEYKRGRLRKEEEYEVQLCAQAICLEEMLDTVIPYGYIFYGKTRRRLEITFDKALRGRTEKAAQQLHHMLASGKTPLPVSVQRIT